VQDLLLETPHEKQVCVFSTTVSLELSEFIDKWTKNVLVVNLRDERNLTLEAVHQFYIACECEAWKFETLTDLYETCDIVEAIIFVNTRKKAAWLGEQLRARKCLLFFLIRKCDHFLTTTEDGDLKESTENFYSTIIEECPANVNDLI
jgi:superfamily II DNA/RNA helicase